MGHPDHLLTTKADAAASQGEWLFCYNIDFVATLIHLTGLSCQH